MSTISILITIASVIAGGLITWWFSRHYYVAAGKELVAEAQELRQLTVLVLRALEAGGIYKMSRNASGGVVGLAHTGSGNLVMPPATVSGDGESGVSARYEEP